MLYIAITAQERLFPRSAPQAIGIASGPVLEVGNVQFADAEIQGCEFWGEIISS